MLPDGNPLKEAFLNHIKIPEIPVDPVYLEEHVFRKTWMPMFMRYFAGHEEGVVAMWGTNVAGNFYKPVKVVTDMNRPEETVVFTVPPLCDNSLDVIPSEVATNISEIVAEADLNNKAFPGSGDNILVKNIINLVNAPTANLKDQQAWREIYKYYNLDAPFVNQTEKEKAKDSSKALNSLVEDYNDDF